MPRATTWGDLKLGLATLAFAAVAGVGVLRYARVGALHGDSVRLYAATASATGLLPGSEVWLHGQKVGVVREVGFRPPTTDTLRRVLIGMDVLTEAMPQIRRDAPIDVRAGGSLIGSPVVWIGGGSLAAARASEGDTLVARYAAEFDAVRAEFARATTEVPQIIDNLRVLSTQLGTARGTLGALGIEGSRQLAASSATAGELVARATRGPGTVGRFLTRGEVMANARHSMALADSIGALLSSSTTSLGRLRRDSTLIRTVAELQRDLRTVQAALVEPRGSAGRFVHDSALVRQVAATRAEVDALAADIRRNPLRYLVF